jgi:hypothetical protein
MPINFNCPACGRIIAAEVSPGTQVRCPLCNQVVVVPSPGGTAPSVVPMWTDLSYAPMGEPPRQGLAIAALVCGIVGLVGCPLVGLVGLIMGIVALSRTNREPARYGGRGMAIGGITTGALSFVVFALFVGAGFPALARARELSKRTVCMANMRGIGQALYIYAQDGGMFPEAGADWQKRLLDANISTPKHFICPSSSNVEGECSYIYVPGYGVNSDPTQIILYEPPENHKGEGGNILYQVGHVKFVASPEYEAAIGAIKTPDKPRETQKKSSRNRAARSHKDKIEKEKAKEEEPEKEEEE